MNVFSVTEGDLTTIANLHAKVFPASISSQLGLRFCLRSFHWYLADSRCYLFYVQNEEDTVVGYCGGMLTVPGKPGSATSMIQFAFQEAVLGFLMRPWLLLHPEVRGHWPLMLRNVARKLGWRHQTHTGTATPASAPPPSMGLVVIGVAPEARNQGIGQVLLNEFERRARLHGAEQAHLSVKKSNLQAHRAYEKAGWICTGEDGANFVFTKVLP